MVLNSGNLELFLLRAPNSTTSPSDGVDSSLLPNINLTSVVDDGDGRPGIRFRLNWTHDLGNKNELSADNDTLLANETLNSNSNEMENKKVSKLYTTMYIIFECICKL